MTSHDLQHSVVLIEEGLCELWGDVVMQQVAEDGPLSVAWILSIPHLIEGTPRAILLCTPTVLYHNIVHTHSLQCGVDLSSWLAAIDGVDMLCPIPGRGGQIGTQFGVGTRRLGYYYSLVNCEVQPISSTMKYQRDITKAHYFIDLYIPWYLRPKHSVY